MNDAGTIASPAKEAPRTVGNSPVVQSAEKVAGTSKNRAWSTRDILDAKEVENPRKSSRCLPSPYWAYGYPTFSPGEESGEGIPVAVGTSLGYDDNGNLTSYGTDLYGVY